MRRFVASVAVLCSVDLSGFRFAQGADEILLAAVAPDPVAAGIASAAPAGAPLVAAAALACVAVRDLLVEPAHQDAVAALALFLDLFAPEHPPAPP